MRIKLGLITAIAAVLILGVAPTAHAADHSMTTKGHFEGIEDPVGSMWFNEHGDSVTLCDRNADGEKPILHVALGDPYNPDREYELTVGGKDNCIHVNAASGSKYNLPENANIGFLICQYPDGYCNAATWHNDK